MTDLEYLKIAYEFARDNSTDPSTQNGAVLVNDNGDIVAYGANHFPYGVKETEDRWKRPIKYDWVVHAESGSIFNAAKNGVKTDGLTMYCPWFACSMCSRAIVQAGVRRVIGHDCELHKSSINWKDSIAIALTMFDEAKIEYKHIQGEFGVKIRFNEKEVTV